MSLADRQLLEAALKQQPGPDYRQHLDFIIHCMTRLAVVNEARLLLESSDINDQELGRWLRERTSAAVARAKEEQKENQGAQQQAERSQG